MKKILLSVILLMGCNDAYNTKMSELLGEKKNLIQKKRN
jgi:hypothetical protein